MNSSYENKLEENLKLMRQMEELKKDMNEQERQKEILTEKVSMLEQNNSIYERELKERRGMYDQLLEEKSRIQRDILMEKKIKMEQSRVDLKHKATVADITSRIDHLLDLERQRSRKIHGSPEHRSASPGQ